MNKRHLQILAFCLSLILIQNVFAQSSGVSAQGVQPHAINLDLEQGEIGQMPAGWFSRNPNYSAVLTEEYPKTGKRAALLQSGAQPTKANEFGNLMQVFDATPFRGRRIRFKAAVRMAAAGVSGRAALWMRVDRDQHKMGFFDNMGDRPILAGDWRYFEIVGDVDEDAAVINIGMMLSGKGKAWLDDVSITDMGKLVVLAEPARPLTPQGLDNLVAFTRLLGYVRHFYPGDEAAITNWDTFAVEGIRIAELATTPADLAQKLETLFHPVAPLVRVFPGKENPALPPELKPQANEISLKIVSWRHKGFGQTASRRPNVYESRRVSNDASKRTIAAEARDPQKPFIVDLGGGVSCLIPLALFTDAKGTLPHINSPVKDPKTDLVKYSGNDRSTRLADVALAWNVLQHFYPYFDVVKVDWPQVLRETLIAAANDSDEMAFLKTLRRMIAQLQDGHGGIYHTSDSGVFYGVPVVFGWVEGRLIVTQVAGEAGDLRPGDVVVKVDGKPSAEVLTEKEALISGATLQWRRFNSVYRLGFGSKDSQMVLDVLTQNGQTRSVMLQRTLAQPLEETRPPKVQEVKPGIFYLDLDRIVDADFQAALPKLETAKGIIFDLRGYPKVSPDLICHLIDKPATSARWNIPVVTTPDHVNFVYTDEGRWDLQPKNPHLKAKIAFITDGRAISYAESYMGIIEAYKLAEIVGETTAGTNGNINPFTLPGNYQVIWTGMKVLKHDGSQHHGIGIQPTVPVSRTIRGVAEKRDEQLERAIAIVSQ
jgi:C-terminal processing protease CtpA/Prc